MLVGEVESLPHTVIAFVRLASGALLGDLTEVPIPTRFIFVLLGPLGNRARYHEVGRSIATLMSDPVRRFFKIVVVVMVIILFARYFMM